VIYSAHGVLFIKYASVLPQAMSLRADEDFLFALIDFSKVQGASWEEQTPE
jgi:vacuolar protein sorting-associated protein 13A/C